MTFAAPNENAADAAERLTMTDPIAYELGLAGDRQMDVYECIAQVEADYLDGIAKAADEAAESHDWTEWNEDSLTLEAWIDYNDGEPTGLPLSLPDDDDFTFLPDDYDRLEV